MTGHPWDSAVAAAAEYPAAREADAITDELKSLWGDLDGAYRHANNGMWSVGCDDLVTRIVRLSRLVGVTHWEHIGYPLILNGIYDGVLTSAQIAYAEPDLGAMQLHAEQIGATRCPECELWDGHHTKPCSRRSRTPYERDQERLADFAARHGF